MCIRDSYKVKVGLGTDVGAGTSFSQLQSLNEAYKVMQLQGARLDPFKSLYLAKMCIRDRSPAGRDCSRKERPRA